MPGGTQAYRCDRCPLIVELGGGVALDDDGVVHSEMTQVACAACGTMHRLTEERGVCTVTAMPGPVRDTHPVPYHDATAYTAESIEWATEDEWRPVGPHPGGFAALDQLACSHCGEAGRMWTLGMLRDAIGYNNPNAPQREFCLVCGGTAEGFSISDWI